MPTLFRLVRRTLLCLLIVSVFAGCDRAVVQQVRQPKPDPDMTVQERRLWQEYFDLVLDGDYEAAGELIAVPEGAIAIEVLSFEQNGPTGRLEVEIENLEAETLVIPELLVTATGKFVVISPRIRDPSSMTVLASGERMTRSLTVHDPAYAPGGPEQVIFLSSTIISSSRAGFGTIDHVAAEADLHPSGRE